MAVSGICSGFEMLLILGFLSGTGNGNPALNTSVDIALDLVPTICAECFLCQLEEILGESQWVFTQTGGLHLKFSEKIGQKSFLEKKKRVSRVSLEPFLRGRKMRTHFFCTNFFGHPQRSQTSRQNSRDIPVPSSKPKENKLSREGTNFLTTTPLRRRTPPHPPVSKPKK